MCSILFLMFDSFHEIFCLQIKRSFNDIFICDNNLKFLVHKFHSHMLDECFCLGSV